MSFVQILKGVRRHQINIILEQQLSEVRPILPVYGIKRKRSTYMYISARDYLVHTCICDLSELFENILLVKLEA